MRLESQLHAWRGGSRRFEREEERFGTRHRMWLHDGGGGGGGSLKVAWKGRCITLMDRVVMLVCSGDPPSLMRTSTLWSLGSSRLKGPVVRMRAAEPSGLKKTKKKKEINRHLSHLDPTRLPLSSKVFLFFTAVPQVTTAKESPPLVRACSCKTSTLASHEM